MNWKDEPKAIKTELTKSGFVVLSARKGTGTAGAWNKIKIENKYGDWQKSWTEANRIAEKLIGHDKVNIDVR